MPTAIKSKNKKDGRSNNGKSQDSKYDPTIPVKCYELIRGGTSIVNAAKLCGVSGTSFFAWMKKYPALKDAVDRAQSFKKGGGTDTFRDYIFGRLSESARRTWKRIHKFERAGKEKKMRALLERKGKNIRQQLFFYAIIASNFNISLALRKVCLSHSQYQAWMQTDADFSRLVKELDWHKGNYFESALMKLVRDGDSAATIFASKTFNRDRGYNEKVEHSISVTHTVQNSVQDILSDLPVDLRKEILTKIREAKAKKALSMDEQQAVEIKEIIDERKEARSVINN